MNAEFSMISLRKGLESGHSPAPNPKGCERVAGGRRGGSGGGDLRVTAWRMSCTPAGVAARRGSIWHPSAVRETKPRFPVVVLPLAPNDHRLPSVNPPGWLPTRSRWSSSAGRWRSAPPARVVTTALRRQAGIALNATVDEKRQQRHDL